MMLLFLYCRSDDDIDVVLVVVKIRSNKRPRRWTRDWLSSQPDTAHI